MLFHNNNNELWKSHRQIHFSQCSTAIFKLNTVISFRLFFVTKLLFNAIEFLIQFKFLASLALLLTSKVNIHSRLTANTCTRKLSREKRGGKALFPDLYCAQEVTYHKPGTLRYYQILGAFLNPRFAFTKRIRLSKGVDLI